MRIMDFPLAVEVMNSYIQLRKSGHSRADTIQELMQQYVNEITSGAEDDGLLFWVGLADAQFSQKELTEEIAQHGICALDAIQHTDWNVAAEEIERRRKNYSFEPMPERKSRTKKKYQCCWELGDTFAHLITGAEAEKCGIAGSFALLHMVDKIKFGDGRILPVVTITLWSKDKLPSNSQEFQMAPMLKLASGRFGTSKSRYEYRAEIIIKSEKQLSLTGLHYIGKYPSIAMPDDETVFSDPGDVMMLLLDKLDEECCLFWKAHNYYTAKG